MTAGARPTLTRRRILQLALDIIDREGLPALNMRRLAAEAGVKPMSLYHHFPNKEAILDGVAECIAAAALGDAAEADRGDASGETGTAAEATGRDATSRGAAGRAGQTREDWRARVRLLFVGLYELVQAHPRALPLISTGVFRTPSGRRWMEQLMGVLLEAGFTPDQAAELYHTVGGFTLGLGYAGLLSLEVQPARIVAELAGHRDQYPNLLAVGLRLADWDRPDEFATGLDTLLDHYAARPPRRKGRR